MFATVDFCDVWADKERLFDVTSMICPSQAQESPVEVYNRFPKLMIDDVRTCGSQIINATAKSRSAKKITGIDRKSFDRNMITVYAFFLVNIGYVSVKGLAVP